MSKDVDSFQRHGGQLREQSEDRCTRVRPSYVPKITEINVLRISLNFIDGRVMRCELAGYEKDIDYARFKHEKSRTIQSITVQSQ